MGPPASVLTQRVARIRASSTPSSTSSKTILWTAWRRATPPKSSQRSRSKDIRPVASKAASNIAEYPSPSINSPVKSSKTANRGSDRSKNDRIPSGSRSLYAPAYLSRPPCASNPMLRPFTRW
jgi:hypothetical protein